MFLRKNTPCNYNCVQAFFAITLREGGLFYHAYTAEGGDYTAVWAASLSFCVIGSLLLLVEGAFVFVLRPVVALESEGMEARLEPAAVTFCVILLEDIPQIVLQNIYFVTVGGFDNADQIAVFAFVCSCLSLALNLFTSVGECCAFFVCSKD